MMGAFAALCIDEESCANPELVGLGGEVLDKQEWLALFSVGSSAREYVAAHNEVERVWVISCEDVEPINLAASMKTDRPDLNVVLVDSDACGSVLSRAHNAHVDDVVGLTVFVRQYGEMKGLHSAIAARVPTSKHARIEREALPRPEQPTPGRQTREQPTRERLARERSAIEVVGQKKTDSTIGNRDKARELVDARVQLGGTSVVNRAKPQTFVLPVVSGSGGAGKSAASVVAAFLAHRRGYQTLLLDYDLQFGDMAYLSGVQNPIAIDEAFGQPGLVERERTRGGGPVVIAPPARLEAADLIVDELPRRFDEVIGNFDVVIANTGAAWAEQHAALLERSSAALFLVDQRASSIRACKHALDLCTRCGIATGPFKFAVNRCAKNAPFTSIDISCALQGAPVFELKDGGRDVEELLGIGAPDQLIDSKNDFCVSLLQVLVKLLPENGRRVESESPSAQNGGGRHRGFRGGLRRGRGRS